MNKPDFDKNQLRRLMAEALDGRIGADERLALNHLLTTNAEARSYYRQMMDLHARLHLEYNGGGGAEYMPGNPRSQRAPRQFAIIPMVVILAAACLTLLAAFLLRQDNSAEQSFATLQSAHSATWSSGDLPTTSGSRLGSGTLRLIEGLVVLRFDSGAEVTLEAPADLKLIDAMNCHLLSGTAVAHIPETAIGFRVETPSAVVIDYGTRFAVSVDSQTSNTRAQVFEGLIEVQNPATGEAVSLKTGQSTFIDGQLTGPVTNGLEEWFLPKNTNSFPEDQGWILREASKDGYIGHPLETDSVELLYVKNGKSDFHRKAYIGFDLSGIDPARIHTTELILNFEPTGLGLASHVPDATFTVYGLLATDQPWDEKNLTPDNAPANIPSSGDMLIADEVTKLGNFTVPQGMQRGQFGITGESLTQFLQGRVRSTITLIIVRETPETSKTGLVHGIASHRHPSLPAPTLAIRLSEEK